MHVPERKQRQQNPAIHRKPCNGPSGVSSYQAFPSHRNILYHSVVWAIIETMTQAVTTIRKSSKTDQSQWDKRVLHPLQSWAWGEFRRAMGIDVEQWVTEKNGAITDVWQLTFHAIPATPWTIGYLPKGPTPTKKMIEELTRLGKSKKAIFIQLEPNVLKNNKTPQYYQNLSVRPSHHPLFTNYTFTLDLTKPEETLLKAMHPKTRYNIKVAQRHDVIIKADDSLEAFNHYLTLTEETTARQGFYAHNRTYHQTMWRIMHAAGIAHLFTATYQGKMLAAWIVFRWRTTLYYPYGASSREHREVMAPSLLLWEIARWAKANGCTSFDLWGALGPEPDSRDPWFGFHRFKQGFAPDMVEFAGSYDLVINPLLYRLYTIADSLRWFLLKLKK